MQRQRAFRLIILTICITGLVNPNCVNFIGNGVVVHVPSFFAELDAMEKKGEPRVLKNSTHTHTHTVLIQIFENRPRLQRTTICIGSSTACFRFPPNCRWTERGRIREWKHWNNKKGNWSSLLKQSFPLWTACASFIRFRKL